MKRLFQLLIFLFLLSSCTSGKKEYYDVDMTNVHYGRLRMSSLCSGIEILPLAGGPENEAPLALSKMSVTAYGYLFLDSEGRIISYGPDGRYASHIKYQYPFEDYSVYKDRTVDAFGNNHLLEYDLKDFTLTRATQLTNHDASFYGIMRCMDNLIALSGCKDGIACQGEYYTDTGRFYIIKYPVPTLTNDISLTMSSSCWFRSAGQTYLFFANTGDIWYRGLFSSPQYRWRYKGYEPGPADFKNVQMTQKKIYSAFLKDEKPHLLVFDRFKEKVIVMRGTHECVDFPLGVIRDNVNYYCCHSRDLADFTVPSLMHKDDLKRLDSLKRTDCNVIIKYILR